MSVHPFPPPVRNPVEERAEYYRGFLHELLEMGMELARAVQADAKAADPKDPAAPKLLDLVTAYERVSRGIRRTIMLAQRLDAPPSQASAQHRASARRRIIREVEDAIHARARPGDKEYLQAELRERLDGPDILEDVDHRPIPEIIAEICRDLGVAAQLGAKPWKRRTPEDIAALCALAAQPDPAANGSAVEPLFPPPQRE
ncbi:MAG: hypothetical protein JOZ05_18170 [Acetobacteraceae bacterium]|nr:hypothetical protein [Acetobacteraceae bacterium]